MYYNKVLGNDDVPDIVLFTQIIQSNDHKKLYKVSIIGRPNQKG